MHQLQLTAILVPAALALVAAAACGGTESPIAGSSGDTSSSTSSSGSSSGASTSSGGSTSSTSSGSSGTSTSSASSSGTSTSSASSTSSSSGSSGAPTWTMLYTSYMPCTGSSCHTNTRSGIKCDTKTDCYNTLTSAGFISGTSSPIAVSGQSCLTYFGGAMPPGGGKNAQAVTDFKAWAAAGAADD